MVCKSFVRCAIGARLSHRQALPFLSGSGNSCMAPYVFPDLDPASVLQSLILQRLKLCTLRRKPPCWCNSPTGSLEPLRYCRAI